MDTLSFSSIRIRIEIYPDGQVWIQILLNKLVVANCEANCGHLVLGSH